MYTNLSDRELIETLRRSSDEEKKEIFLALYERYKLLVLKSSYKYVRNYELASDILHDVFIRMIEHVEAIKNPGVFKSWLMTITRNTCVDYLRKTSYMKREIPLTANVEIATGERSEDKFVAEIDRQKIMIQLKSCILNLDAHHLNVFKLRWQGLKAAQIVKVLKTDKSELRRCYDKIKANLENCMKRKGFKISIDQILYLGEIDE